MGDAGGSASAAVSRTAVFVDYENLYYEDRKAYGPDGLKRLASDLITVAKECGPVTLAKAIAPFDEIPGAAQAFIQAGFDPQHSPGGRIKNAADLLVVQHLMAIEPKQDIGVVFLVSGDAGMLGALQEAQKRGFRVVVVACEGALSKRLSEAADKALSVREIQAEAGRLARNKPPQLGLREMVLAWSAPARRPAQKPASTATGFQISPSALKVFAQCPRQYAFIHVEKRRAPANRHMFVGTCVHQALKEFFSLNRRDRTPKALEDLLRKAWSASPGRRQAFPAGKEAEETEAGREAIEDLRSFFRQADVRTDPLGLEIFGRTALGEGVVVTGKIDRLDAGTKAGSLVITDYKTGKAPTSKPSLFEEFQLPLYAAMVGEARAEAVERVVLHYLKGNVEHEYRLGDPDIRRAKDRALGLAREIRAAGEFLPRVNPLCGWCAFLPDCPARAEAEENVASRNARRQAGAQGGSQDGLPF